MFYFRNYISRKSIEVTFVDFGQFDNIINAIKKNTKVCILISSSATLYFI